MSAPYIGFEAKFEDTPHWPPGRDDELVYPGERHLLLVGPNGSGKGTRILVPNLATLDRSILVIDPKGELAAITARKRAEFGRVVILNPFNLLAELPQLRSTRFNPLAALDPEADDFPDDAMGLAEALVRIEGSDPHWSASAQDLVAALIMHVRRDDGPEAQLGTVRKLLNEPTITRKLEDSNTRVPVSGFGFTAALMARSGFDPLEAKAGRFVNATREIDSIVSTASTQTRFLDSPAIIRDLKGPEASAERPFDFADMKRETVTVYLILPANRLDTHSGWLRLIIVTALRALMRSPANRKRPPVLFILDEFAQLGYLRAIENAMGIARGYGIQLWPILQDINQLKALYHDRWESFLANAGLLLAFTPQDMTTAEQLSRRAGQTERSVKSEGQSVGGDGRTNISFNVAPHVVPLYRPEELMGMREGMLMGFVERMRFPFFTHAPYYFDFHMKARIDPAGKLDPNPYYQVDP